MLINFENIEQKCSDIINSSSYKDLVLKVDKSKKIFLLGNGGLHFVSSHMATDLTRLIKNKSVYSFDSVGFITSNANDHGYEQLFVRWLETITSTENLNDCLVIGMSCSGNSSNIINALHWANSNNFDTFLISGQKSEYLENNIDELCCNCEYFHTVEVICMMIFYEMIHRIGSRCPSITNEKIRMSKSFLRGNK